MTRLLAIDPGDVESGWVLLDIASRQPLEFEKSPNSDVLDVIARQEHSLLVVEMIASYGMPVGASVFETCVWIGRFLQHDRAEGGIPQHVTGERLESTQRLVKRQPVKVHHCHSAKAKDSNVRQALVDRFAPGQSNHGKGTKTNPGFFYGFRADVWQAYALAVYAADTLTAPTPTTSTEANF
jgi:hypothetical protein